MTDPSTKPRLNEAEKHLLREAADQIDVLWDYQSAIKRTAPRESSLYMRQCLAPRLRELAS